VVEDHNRAAPGVVPGDLDGVLDRLGAGVEQGRGLVEVARVSSFSASATATYGS